MVDYERSRESIAPIASAREPATLAWMLLVLASHLGWGAYPVLGRYLQTVAHLPSFTLLAAGMVMPASAALIWLSREPGGYRSLRRPILWAFAMIVMARSVTNLLAARFTLATSVQLITLMTPFEVALLGHAFFGERIPYGTYRAIRLSLLGALLMMSGHGLSLRLGSTDLLGMAFALASSLFLALYMLVVRRAAMRDVPIPAVFTVHSVTALSFATVMSIGLGERWEAWQSLSPFGWLIFAGFSAGVLLGANSAQLWSIGRLGASLVSSLMATRLLAVLAAGALVLGERLETPLQGLGALIVAATISWYLFAIENRGRTGPD